jgi:hypothetical protein
MAAGMRDEARMTGMVAFIRPMVAMVRGDNSRRLSSRVPSMSVQTARSCSLRGMFMFAQYPEACRLEEASVYYFFGILWN